MTEQTENFGSTGRWFRKLGQKLGRAAPRSREDIVEFFKEANAHELVDADALFMIQGVLGTADLQVRDIMVPRAQMVVVDVDWPLKQVLPTVVESGHSRFPVHRGSKDKIIGIMLAKDLLRFSAPDAEDFNVESLLRPAVFVPESKRVNVLLKEFRSSRSHMAVVVDEYGGVSGLVTIEDVIEQIVGEIADEYDETERAMILRQDEKRYLVNGLTTIAEFNRHFSANFSDQEFDTVGGLVVHRFGHMPRRGESVKLDRFQFNVQRADSRRVHQLQVTVIAPEA